MRRHPNPAPSPVVKRGDRIRVTFTTAPFYKIGQDYEVEYVGTHDGEFFVVPFGRPALFVALGDRWELVHEAGAAA